MTEIYNRCVQVNRRASELFIWTDDREIYGVPERWETCIAAYRAGQIFREDCDGFAMTCCDAMRYLGTPPSDLRLVTCVTETGEGHAVLEVARKWIIDNRQRAIWPWGALRYSWLAGMDCDKPGQWVSLVGREGDQAEAGR